MEKKNKLDASKGIPYKPLCNEDLRKITDHETALNKNFHVVNLTAPLQKHLQIRAYVDYHGGYAEHGRQTILGLHDTGRYAIKLTPIQTPLDIDPIAWQKFNWFTKNPAFIESKSDLLTIAGPGWLQEKFISKNRRNIAWTMIESYAFHPMTIPWMNNADLILCPTDTDMDRCRRSGINKIEKVHLGYDPNLFNVYTRTRPLNIPELKGRFVFGVHGSWNKRKGIKEIIRAFCKTFKKNDPVSLLLACKYGTRPYDCSLTGRKKENDDRWCIEWEFNFYLEEFGIDKENAPHIAILDIPLHESVMAPLTARFDALVGFSMGESTWLPGLQSMAMGIPIIQLNAETNGCREYLHDVGFMCERVKYESADDELALGTSEYYEDQLFAQGDWEELAEMMNYVYKAPRKVINQKTDLGLKKASDWTWNESIKQLMKTLEK